MIFNTPDAVGKLEKVKILLLDVDGVMTDGNIIYTDGGAEIKTFCVKDGLGIRLLMNSGIKIGIVTGRTSEALRHRCKNLHIEYIFDGVLNKAVILDKIVEITGIQTPEIAFMGDDLPDIPIMRGAGIPIAVADAHEKVIESACIVTSAKGGNGAIREVCEAILKARGEWESVLKRF
ncbi:MAG: phenylphosphate carboxylase subunit delta [Desulfobacteraceae bacterium]|nr:MAG: phenylphosphate carboxylase subunit delta [Desulfobacteraceae bacterium]